MALAIDHRAQLEEMANAASTGIERIAAFKVLAVRATEKVAAGRAGVGMLLDDKLGRQALFAAEKLGLRIASRDVVADFDGRDVKFCGQREELAQSRPRGNHVVEGKHRLTCRPDHSVSSAGVFGRPAAHAGKPDLVVRQVTLVRSKTRFKFNRRPVRGAGLGKSDPSPSKGGRRVKTESGRRASGPARDADRPSLLHRA